MFKKYFSVGSVLKRPAKVNPLKKSRKNDPIKN